MIGRFIVFEGVEGCGKTTQLQRLKSWLIPQSSEVGNFSKGTPKVLTTREPGGTELGKMLRGILLGQENYTVDNAIDYRTELLLYAADRAQHVSEVLVPHIEQGGIVLCDRYTDSTVAYQGYGRGLDRTLIDQLNAIATNRLQSDLTLWLDLDAELGLKRTQKRGAADRMEQSDLEFHRRVQRGFQDLAADHPDRIVRIDAAGEPDDVARRIQDVVSKRFAQWDAEGP